MHIEQKHIENKKFICVLKDCEQIFDNIKLLTRHIIFTHCDLRSIKIYGSCSQCDLSYSNFLDFNKHTCYQGLKRKSGCESYCAQCKLHFSSFKRYLFHLQFHLPKRRPKYCLICGIYFKDINEFFEHVQYIHEQVDHYTCVSCDLTYKDIKLFEAHCNNHKKELKFACKHCPKKYDYKRLLNRHMNIYHNQSTKQINCNYCNKQFPNKYSTAYKMHLKSHEHIEAEVQVFYCTACGLIARDKDDLVEHTKVAASSCFNADIEMEIIACAYVCEFCSSDFKSAQHLQAHRATGIHSDNQYQCHTCKQKYTNIKNLRNHEKTHTRDQWTLALTRLFMCNIENCLETYVKWNGLHNHRTRGHQEDICPTCKVTFQSMAQMKAHAKTCNELILKCQFCDKVCPTKMSLSIHIARSHNNDNVLCPTCKAAFSNKSALEKHIDYVHVPIACCHCHKILKNKRNFEVHQRVVHEQEKRYFCKTCNKGFYYKNELKQHEKNVHTLISYKCNLCTFTTNYEKSLSIHKASHHNVGEYKCPHCIKTFGRKGVLDLHIKRHDDQREFVCCEHIEHGCDASFVSYYYLKKHINEKHSSSSTAKRIRRRNLQLENKENPDDPVVMDDFVVVNDVVTEDTALAVDTCVADVPLLANEPVAGNVFIVLDNNMQYTTDQSDNSLIQTDGDSTEQSHVVNTYIIQNNTNETEYINLINIEDINIANVDDIITEYEN